MRCVRGCVTLGDLGPIPVITGRVTGRRESSLHNPKTLEKYAVISYQFDNLLMYLMYTFGCSG